jgi:hypothetical protein
LIKDDAAGALVAWSGKELLRAVERLHCESLCFEESREGFQESGLVIDKKNHFGLLHKFSGTMGS